MRDDDDLPSLGDRRAMKLYSWLDAVRKELLRTNPTDITTLMSPEMIERVCLLGPVVARWLLLVAKSAEAIKQKQQ
jgi:hypothetical protein